MFSKCRNISIFLLIFLVYIKNPLLINLLLYDNDLDVRLKAIISATMTKDPRIVKPFIVALRDKDVNIRQESTGDRRKF